MLHGWVCLFVLRGDKVDDALTVGDDSWGRGVGTGGRGRRSEPVVRRLEVGPVLVERGRGKRFISGSLRSMYNWRWSNGLWLLLEMLLHVVLKLLKLHTLCGRMLTLPLLRVLPHLFLQLSINLLLLRWRWLLW